MIPAGSKPGEPALVTAMFSRRLAAPVARLCVRLGVSANAVTVAGGLCWLVSLALPPLAMAVAGDAKADPGALVPLAWLWLAAAALWCLGYFLDVVDGSVARLTGTGSDAGFFLDYVFHVLFKPAFLFSVGLGLGPIWFFLALPGPVGPLVFLVLLLSIPANGSQASHASELALRAECAAGRLRPGEGPAALWLGSDAVAAPASAKRGTPMRVAATLAREVASYYLQAPLFALAVALDAIPLLVRGRPLVPLGPMPCTAALWFVLGLVLAIRIPLRCAREWRRLGLAPDAALASRLRAAWRRFFLRLGFEPILVLFAVFVFSCVTFAYWTPPVWTECLLFALSPFAAVLCAPAEEIAAAHVFCRTAAKGGSPDPAGAPWRPPLVLAAFAVPLLAPFATLPVDLLFRPADASFFPTDAFRTVAFLHGASAVLLSQLLVLPARLRRVHRRLSGRPGGQP